MRNVSPFAPRRRTAQLFAHARISVFLQVGTSRCDVPARAIAGGTHVPWWATQPVGCAAERGADGVARRPYQKLRCALRPLGPKFRIENRPWRCKLRGGNEWR